MAKRFPIANKEVFPPANDEIRAILSNPDISKVVEGVEGLIFDGKDLTTEQWHYYRQRIDGQYFMNVVTRRMEPKAKIMSEISPGHSRVSF